MSIWQRFLGRPVVPTRRDRHDYRVADVAGTWTRTIVGSTPYEQAVNNLPLGPVSVTLHLEQRGSDSHAVAAYVGEDQVGWLATQRSFIESRLASGFLWRDPTVTWMTKLDAAGIRPRVQGSLRVAGDSGKRLIKIDFPGRNDPNLSAIAAELIKAGPKRA